MNTIVGSHMTCWCSASMVNGPVPGQLGSDLGGNLGGGVGGSMSLLCYQFSFFVIRVLH